MDNSPPQPKNIGTFIYTAEVTSRMPKLVNLSKNISPDYRFKDKARNRIHLTKEMMRKHPACQSGYLSSKEFRVALGNYFGRDKYVDIYEYMYVFTVGHSFDGPEAKILPEKNFCDAYYLGLFQYMVEHAKTLINSKATTITNFAYITKAKKWPAGMYDFYIEEVIKKLEKTESFLVILNDLGDVEIKDFLLDMKNSNSPYKFRFIQISNTVLEE